MSDQKPEQAQPTKPWHSRPALWGKGVMVAVALVSLWLAYDGWYRQPIYQISWIVQKQIVFDYSNAASAINVLDKAGNAIKSDMYAAQFTVWNSGNQRFDNVSPTSLIRQPLTFTLKGEGKIISASITSGEHDTNGGWAIQRDDRKAVMEWKHFDPHAAARILVLYAGDAATEIDPNIQVADDFEFRRADVTPKGQPEYRNQVEAPIPAFIGVGLLMVAVYLVERGHRVRDITFWVLFLSSVPLLALVGLIVGYLVTPYPVPSF